MKKLLKVYLKNGEIYVIIEGHNDDMYAIVDNHLYELTTKTKGFFIFRKEIPIKKDLGEIDHITESKI